MNQSKLSNTATISALVLVGLHFICRLLLEFDLLIKLYDLFNFLYLIFAIAIYLFAYQLFSLHYKKQKWLIPIVLIVLVYIYNIVQSTPIYNDFINRFSVNTRLWIIIIAGIVNLAALIWRLILLFRRNKDTHLERATQLYLVSNILGVCTIILIPTVQFALHFQTSNSVFLAVSAIDSIALFILFWSELKFEPATPELRGQKEDDINFEFEEKQ